MTDVSDRIKEYAGMTEAALEQFLNFGGCRQQKVIDAMRYSLEAGGKRIRPVLVLEFCRVFGGNPADALPFAAAIEMIHTYSLIHDDLPCMDNDAMRRGKPSCHAAFGEDTALLAGDGLLTLAFSVMAGAKLPARTVCRAVGTLADASGVMGMIGGQVIDLASEGQRIDLDILLELDALKTGALLRAAAKLGCIAGGADERQTALADRYAADIGLSFQIVDDMLDLSGSTEELGKPVGSDLENQKSTFVSLYGMDGAREKVRALTRSAKDALREMGTDTEFLEGLTDYLANRTS